MSSSSCMTGVQFWLTSLHLCSLHTHVSVNRGLIKPRCPMTPGTATLQAQCRAEASEPCPRAVLVCCAALASGALQTPDIFREPCLDRQADIHLLLGALHAGKPLHRIWRSR